MHPRSRMYSICRHRERMGHQGTESPIPSLTPPDGSVTGRTGTGGGGDEWDADARIRTDLGVDRLVDHYGAQLREHGWTPIERTAGQRIAVVESSRVTGPEGGAWHAVLTAAAPSNDAERLLSIRVTRLERRR